MVFDSCNQQGTMTRERLTSSGVREGADRTVFQTRTGAIVLVRPATI
jgi:hypothetical protein